MTALLRQNGFGMKLQTDRCMITVLNCHDFALWAFGKNVQTRREVSFSYNQRMVSPYIKGIEDILKNAITAMRNVTAIAMHRVFGSRNTSPKRVTDGLMTKANAQNRNMT